MIGHSCSMSFWTSNKITGQRSGTSCFKKNGNLRVCVICLLYWTLHICFPETKTAHRPTLKCHQWNKKVVYLHKKTRPDGGLFGFFTTFSPHCCCEILWLIIKCLTDCCVCTADWLKLCCVVSSFRALYTGPMGRDQRQSLGSWTRPPGAVPAWLGR